jgi:hypothetical protein
MRTDRRGESSGVRRRPLRPVIRWRPVLISAFAGAMLLRAPHVAAASFEPGSEPDPPTGAVPVVVDGSQEDIDGIRWEFAPLSYSGSLSIDGRWQNQNTGLRSRQALTVGDIEAATYIWQPWFVQLRFGLGLVLSRETSKEAGAPSHHSSSPSTTGRLNLSVFPMSRFPFSLRAQVGDSRVQGDTLGADYRTQRLTVSQAYAPENGSSHYNLMFDHGRRTTMDGAADAVTSLSGTASQQWADQNVDLSAQHVINRPGTSGAQTRNSAISLHHNYNPTGALQADSLASWNRSRFSAGDGAEAFDASSDIRQVSTFANWRPRAGEVQTQQLTDGGTGDQQAVNLALGVSKDLTPQWRFSGSASVSVIRSPGQDGNRFINSNLGTTYVPQAIPLGEWRYAPSLGASLGVSQSSRDGSRQNQGVQAAHAISRPYPLGDNDSLSLSLSQSLSASHESQQDGWNRQVVHSSNLSWQGYGGDASQSYASLSLSDSRTMAANRGSFQLANLQISRRTQLSRDASWSGNLTVQTSRNKDRTQASASTTATGVKDTNAAQRFYSGSLSYENRRVFGVPRLRFTALLSLNSEQLESRAQGDIDAPRELITKSLEGRFDYAIGRLNTNLTSRWVEIEGRRVASVFVRVQRQF